MTDTKLEKKDVLAAAECSCCSKCPEEGLDMMIAPCGLDCTKCDAYIATVNDDDELRASTAKLWADMNNAPITPEMINCLGCRSEGTKTPYCEYMCEIRKCAMDKKHDFCAHCGDVDGCSHIKAVIENSEEAKANLEELRRRA